MGYTERQLERAGWGLLGYTLKWLGIAVLIAIPVVLVAVLLLWPFGLIWHYGGHAWYWLTLAIMAEVLWLSVLVVGTIEQTRTRSRSSSGAGSGPREWERTAPQARPPETRKVRLHLQQRLRLADRN